MDFAKRTYDAFVSYSWEDKPVVDGLYQWLTKVAGLKVWMDDRNVKASTAISSQLPVAINDCKAYLLVASKSSLKSNWVRKEIEDASHVNVNEARFRIVILRIDDCDLTSVDDLRTYIFYAMPGGELDLITAEKVLLALDGTPDRRVGWGSKTFFVSRGWRDADSAFATPIMRVFDSYGFRMIGDAPDQPHWDDARIAQIMKRSSGHLLVLPQRVAKNGDVGAAYKYFARELAISRSIGLPSWIVASPDTELPEELDTQSRYIVADETLEDVNGFLARLEEFAEETRPAPIPSQGFLASSYGHRARHCLLASFISKVVGFECKLGTEFQGKNVADQITEAIRASQLVFAVIRSDGQSADAPCEINLNSCIETGIALGAGIEPYVLAARKPGEVEVSTGLPFMFRDYQVNWFHNEITLIGTLFRLARPHRLRVINNELLPD